MKTGTKTEWKRRREPAVAEVALGKTSRAKRYGWIHPSPVARVRFRPGASLCGAVLSVDGWEEGGDAEQGGGRWSYAEFRLTRVNSLI